MKRKIAAAAAGASAADPQRSAPPSAAPRASALGRLAGAEAAVSKSLAGGGGGGNVSGAGDRLGDLLSGWAVPVITALAGCLLVGALASRNIGASVGIVVITLIGADLPARRRSRSSPSPRASPTTSSEAGRCPRERSPQGGALLPAGLPPPLADLPDPELADPAARRPRAAPDRLLARLPGGDRAARPRCRCSGSPLAALPPSLRLLALPLAAAWALSRWEVDGRAPHRALAGLVAWWLRPRVLAAGRRCPAPGSELAPLRRLTAGARPRRAARYPRGRLVGPARLLLRYPVAVESRASRAPRPSAPSAHAAARRWRLRAPAPAAAQGQDARGPGRPRGHLRGGAR